MAAAAAARLSKLQARFKEKLAGAEFRWINEQLYTTTSDSAVEMFTKEPSMFDTYHEGFRSQVRKWPVNPLDVIIGRIRKLPSSHVIADMGCGEARLAASVPHKVHSFDLVAANERIVASDIAHVPLPDQSVDVVVFCLALMGTNYTDFLVEARRILKPGGRVLIAEVRSRIEGDADDGNDGDTLHRPSARSGGASHGPPGPTSTPTSAGLSPPMRRFVQMLRDLGFRDQALDCRNPMFVLIDLVRTDRVATAASAASASSSSSSHGDRGAELDGSSTATGRRGVTATTTTTRLRDTDRDDDRARPHVSALPLRPCLYKRR